MISSQDVRMSDDEDEDDVDDECKCLWAFEHLHAITLPVLKLFGHLCCCITFLLWHYFFASATVTAVYLNMLRLLLPSLWLPVLTAVAVFPAAATVLLLSPVL
ncbi:hypothetical protein RHSIM_Rhsim01G0182100 [Rhododendron simsii]|uniref:Transmembrane protein n=1 Tax=Rhododendron simsii TaxID=118357 RepID=A0A834HGQ8_RHOSS|nr:hypothetical protein RHSIM_Rhsim01G0182100 [Rhododendron simsii]